MSLHDLSGHFGEIHAAFCTIAHIALLVRHQASDLLTSCRVCTCLMQAGILSFVGDVALCDAALTAVTACGGAFVLPVPPRTQLLCVIIVFKTIGKTHAFVCRHHSSSRPEAACRETCRHCSVGQYERTDRNELTQRIAERNTFVSWASSAKKGIVQRADSNPVVTSHTGGSSAAGRPVGHSSPTVHMTLLTYSIT